MSQMLQVHRAVLASTSPPFRASASLRLLVSSFPRLRASSSPRVRASSSPRLLPADAGTIALQHFSSSLV
jgi:hypothetical protein